MDVPDEFARELHGTQLEITTTGLPASAENEKQEATMSELLQYKTRLSDLIGPSETRRPGRTVTLSAEIVKSPSKLSLVALSLGRCADDPNLNQLCGRRVIAIDASWGPLRTAAGNSADQLLVSSQTCWSCLMALQSLEDCVQVGYRGPPRWKRPRCERRKLSRSGRVKGARPRSSSLPKSRRWQRLPGQSRRLTRSQTQLLEKKVAHRWIKRECPASSNDQPREATLFR